MGLGEGLSWLPKPPLWVAMDGAPLGQSPEVAWLWLVDSRSALSPSPTLGRESKQSVQDRRTELTTELGVEGRPGRSALGFRSCP